MPFIERLQEIRRNKAISQHELAGRAGVSIGCIYRLEAGEQIPSCQTLDALAAALEVPVYALFYDGERAPGTPWLSPRLSLEDLQSRPQAPKTETSFFVRVRDELSAMLR